jgi:hypothetical protein
LAKRVGVLPTELTRHWRNAINKIRTCLPASLAGH